jgi:hypothetical protein
VVRLVRLPGREGRWEGEGEGDGEEERRRPGDWAARMVGDGLRREGGPAGGALRWRCGR